MKGFLKGILMIAIALCIFWCYSSKASAEEYEYSYDFSYTSYVDDPYIDWHQRHWILKSTGPFCFYISSENGVPVLFILMSADVEVEAFLRTSYKDEEIGITDSHNTTTWSYKHQKLYFEYLSNVESLSLISVPIFKDLETAENYLITLDDEEKVNKFVPEWEDAQTNNSFWLSNFIADNSINCTWSGLACDSPVIQEEINNYENSYVKVEFYYCPLDELGNVVSYSEYSYYKVSDNGFFIPWEEAQSNNNMRYLQYMKVIPYYYNLDDTTARLYMGQYSIVYYNPDGTLSYYSQNQNEITGGQGGKRRDTKYLNDFFLTGVEINKTLFSNMLITWTGTTVLPLVPDNDTQVIATYCFYDNTMNVNVAEYKTTTIGSGSVKIDYIALSELCEKNGWVWDCQIRLTPTYLSNGILYIGEQSVVDLNTGIVTNESDSGGGTVIKEDVTGVNNLDTDNLLQYSSYAFSIIKGLVNSMGTLPALYATVFAFLPSIFIQSMGVILIIAIVLRVLGR